MAAAATPKPLWKPKDPEKTRISAYRRHVNLKFGQLLRDSQELHQWTIQNPQAFWLDIYDYVNIVPRLPAGTSQAYDPAVPISAVPKWFEVVQLNYTENVLEGRDPDAVALIEIREGQSLDGTKVTWAQLREKVRSVRSALVRSGIKQGDRVAAIVANSVWAIVLFLATASMGAVYTSMGPDLGAEGCITRLTQIEPSMIIADSDATHKGKATSTIEKLEKIFQRLEHKPQIYLISRFTKTSKFPTIEKLLAKASSEDALTYTRVPFSYPLVICYSSGTTGPPKCIVHQHGLILQLRKVSGLHNSLGPGEVVLQMTTTTWVLFYIMNGHLATGATVITYDGAPTWPDATIMMKILEKHRVTYMGTSPRYLLELEQTRCTPKNDFDISSLRMVNTTGASLSAEQYHWFYSVFPSDVWVSNSAGGTDTSTSILVGDPSGPLYPGEMQMCALGMDVDIFDSESGESVLKDGQPGEMVVKQPFPSMPTFFWGDKDGSKYKSAYFEPFEHVWMQHDWLQYSEWKFSYQPLLGLREEPGRKLTFADPATSGFIMTGRSDGVLNPSGVRFGSGEIYAIVEGPEFNAEIANSLCVGRRRPKDSVESVFLFVTMSQGHKFSDDLVKRLREAIKSGLSPRHVPRFIIHVDEIPVTINGKKVEVAVKRIISGSDIKISSTVANPDVLRGYKRYFDVEDNRTSKL